MRVLLITIILILAQKTQAQNNIVFFELAGNALGGSLNYERQLTKDLDLYVRFGIGGALVEENTPSNNYFSANIPNPKLSIPLSIQYLFDLNNNDYIETGLGYTWIDFSKTFENSAQGTHNILASVGYRKHFGQAKTWLWKVNFSPLIGGNGEKGIVFGFSPMAGISFGKRF
jgi:hypothetical protein